MCTWVERQIWQKLAFNQEARGPAKLKLIAFSTSTTLPHLMKNDNKISSTGQTIT